MKRPIQHLTIFLPLLLMLGLSAFAQVTPLGDSYTNTASPTTNYGAKTTVVVNGATEKAYIQFDLTGIPPGANVSKAMLKLYVSTVTTAGSFNVDYVNGSWAESTIDANNGPALGASIASDVSIATTSLNQYIQVDVTSAVQAWLNGSEVNDGVALVANGTTNVAFNSKESTSTSHAPELDIVYAEGLTGVTTTIGSGLIGGGTSGTLNLGLSTSCSPNQVLQWNGSAWACASGGTGTITGVSAGTGLSGGGSSGSVMLSNTGILSLAGGTGITVSSGQTPSVSIDTSVVPQLSVANTFSGNQTVNGNLSATGTVTGSSFQIGSKLFDYGSYANANAFLGFAGNTTMTGTSNTATGVGALGGNTTGSANVGSGQNALSSNTTGAKNIAIGSNALGSNNSGSFNVAVGSGALQWGGSGQNNTAIGQNAGSAAFFDPQNGSNITLLGANTNTGTNTSLSNATAIGANAEVDASNSLVLGSIDGVNGATASTNVGIGTTAPGYPLQVEGNRSDTTGVQTRTINDSTSGISYAVYSLLSGGGVVNTEMLADGLGTGPVGKASGVFGTYSDHPIGFITNDLTRMYIGAGGFVGIGTTSPDTHLSVNGSADKPGGGSWGTFSDRRLKTLQGNFNSGLDQILQIHPVRYRYKPDNAMGIQDTEEHVGLVAQDVQKVIPEAVTKNSKGYLLVNNDPIILAMLNAIKEQDRLIRQQHSQMRAQQAQIARLSSQLKAVETSLKTNGRSGTQVCTVTASVPRVHQ